MNITDMYLEALKTTDDWLIVSDWAKRVGDVYPDLLVKAELEAINQVNETTGLREIAARISSAISRGAYEQKIEIDSGEKPRKIRFLSESQRVEHEVEDVEQDIAPLRRDEIIKQALETISVHDKYRMNEFEAISKQLKTFFNLDFEIDHAHALLNPIDAGSHHPDNFQLLLKAHNSRKNNANWQRFTLEEQIEYIESAIKLQAIVATRFEIDMETTILKSLIERLKSIYLDK